MGYVTTGLSNNGRTQFFNIQYDDGLTTARGLDLATDLMQHCDDDLALLSAWFSGRQLDMSLPIHISLNTVAVDSSFNPTQFVGGHWGPSFGPFPLQVTINIGELPMLSGTAPMLARYLLISEVSEMYMRAFSAHGPNPWFRFGEGNKGEGLSRFLAAKFLLRTFPGIAAIPSLTNTPATASFVWNVTNLWLDSVRDPANLEVNDEDTTPDPVTGCATLFLFYLSDQLGHSIEDIINAGADRLPNLYQNLTNNNASNAWQRFGGLVNAHFPHTNVNGTFTPGYSPPLDTVFPVSDLTLFTAPAQATWPPQGIPGTVNVGVDHPAMVALPVDITSSHPTIIPSLSVTISPSTSSTFRAMAVLPQPAGFSPTSVVLTASYGGRMIPRTVVVVSPGAMGLPALDIGVDRSADSCRPLFVEGTSQTFRINNLNVFADQAGLSYSWSVTGATPDRIDAATLTIPTLPGVGTSVTVRVTVTNRQGLQASGIFSFQTIATPAGLDALQEELQCRLRQFRNGNLHIKPWVPIERLAELPEQLTLLENQLREVTRAAAQLTALTRSMKELAKRGHDHQR